MVAVTAVKPDLVHMHGVREAHWLDRLITDACVFWGEVVPRPRDRRSADEQTSHQDLGRQLVRPLWKDVRHLMVSLRRQSVVALVRYLLVNCAPLINPKSLELIWLIKATRPVWVTAGGF